MNIWWCEEHGERGYVAEVRGVSDPHCWVRDMGPIPCRMVERQLVPLNVRTVGKDAAQIIADRELVVHEFTGRHWNGDWHYLSEAEIDSLLDALAVSESSEAG